MAKKVRYTIWYERSDGERFNVEVGSKAEERMQLEGFTAVTDPERVEIQKRRTVIHPEPAESPLVKDMAKRLAKLEAENAALKAETEKKPDKKNKPKDKKPEPEKKPGPGEGKEK